MNGLYLKYETNEEPRWTPDAIRKWMDEGNNPEIASDLYAIADIWEEDIKNERDDRRTDKE